MAYPKFDPETGRRFTPEEYEANKQRLIAEHGQPRRRRQARYRPLTPDGGPGRPWAVITHTDRGRLTLTTPAGEQHARGPVRARRLLEAHHDHVLYATDAAGLLGVFGPKQWEQRAHNSRINRLTLHPDNPPAERVTVHILEQWREDPTQLVDELDGFLGFAAPLGVRPASIAGMALSLWQAALPEPLSPWAPVGEQAMYGGRQAAPWTPSTWSQVTNWDLQAAYPTAMTSAPYPLRLVQDSTPTLAGDPLDVGVAYATAHLPTDNNPWRLLPGLLNAEPTPDGGVRAWWPLRDLKLAAEYGARLQLHESWHGTRYVEPFGAWWQLCLQARALPRGARLAKVVSNALWGTWASTPDRQTRLRGGGATLEVVPDHQQRASRTGLAYWAAETTARVRDRVYREALAPEQVGAVYVAVDGIMAIGTTPPAPIGDRPGEWQAKATGLELRILDTQLFATRYPTESAWTYSTSGIPADQAERWFEAHWQQATAQEPLR